MSELLTTEELCKMLKVTRTTIERYRKNGMPFKIIGRSVRFDAEEIKKWINEK